MRECVLYRKNQSTAGEVADHLLKCDGNFIPRLSSRVNLMDYSVKLFDHAVRFEAWSNEVLTGLLAVYCNDSTYHTSFISSISVLPASMGKGIASKLMTACIRDSQSLDFQWVGLEVNQNNFNAIKLYEKNGFIIDKTDGLFMTMRLDIRRGLSE